LIASKNRCNWIVCRSLSSIHGVKPLRTGT
jgi:hypothetical protein